MVAPCGGEWALRRYAFRDRKDHHPAGSSYVSEVTQHYFKHEWLYLFIRVVVFSFEELGTASFSSSPQPNFRFYSPLSQVRKCTFKNINPLSQVRNFIL